jgi:hypothetical protein
MAQSLRARGSKQCRQRDNPPQVIALIDDVQRIDKIQRVAVQTLDGSRSYLVLPAREYLPDHEMPRGFQAWMIELFHNTFSLISEKNQPVHLLPSITD